MFLRCNHKFCVQTIYFFPYTEELLPPPKFLEIQMMGRFSVLENDDEIKVEACFMICFSAVQNDRVEETA